MKRLFFALWPEQSTVEQCQSLIAKLDSNGNPVPPDNLHMTLVFLGNIDTTQQSLLTQSANHVRFDPIHVKFDQLEFWQKPGALCLIPSETNPAVLDLNRQLAGIANAYRVPIDKRPFRPHVTLAKKAKSPVTLDFEPISLHADTFCLAESVSTPKGVRYIVIARWPSTHHSGDRKCRT